MNTEDLNKVIKRREKETDALALQLEESLAKIQQNKKQISELE